METITLGFDQENTAETANNSGPTIQNNLERKGGGGGLRVYQPTSP